MKDTVIWNIEEGLKLTGPQIGQAEHKRTELYQRVRQFMERYEFLILPVSQVPPFDVKQQKVDFFWKSLTQQLTRFPSAPGAARYRSLPVRLFLPAPLRCTPVRRGDREPAFAIPRAQGKTLDVVAVDSEDSCR